MGGQSSDRNCRLIESVKKQVHFRPDVFIRVRPSPSNLRPMCRLTRKEGSDCDAFVRALENWDLMWRNYLTTYYDECMLRITPSTQHLAAQERLVALADDCRRTYCVWLANLAACEDARLSTISDVDLQSQLRRLFAARTHILQRLLTSVQLWQEIEQRRWSSLHDAHASVVSHESFCDFVDRVDALQRKYKALCDSIRRVQRKAKKQADRAAADFLASEPLSTCLDSSFQSAMLQKERGPSPCLAI